MAQSQTLLVLMTNLRGRYSTISVHFLPARGDGVGRMVLLTSNAFGHGNEVALVALLRDSTFSQRPTASTFEIIGIAILCEISASFGRPLDSIYGA